MPSLNRTEGASQGYEQVLRHLILKIKLIFHHAVFVVG